MSRRISKEVENRAIEEKSGKVDNWCRSLLGKFSENPEIGEFRKNEPFTRKFWKFWKESQLNRTEIPGRKCPASKHFRARRLNTELHAVK